MPAAYMHHKPVKRSHYSSFRRYMFLTILTLAVIGGVGYFIYRSLQGTPKSSSISKVENTQITDNKTTFTDTYFQIHNTGTWVVDKNNSTDTKRVYHKFRKNVLEHELVVYINQVPIPLYLEV